MDTEKLLNTFEKNKEFLVQDLNETQSQKKRKEILESFELDKKSIHLYVKEVYNEATEDEIRSCEDVIENGPHSLLGILSNIAKQFEHMRSMKEEFGMYEFDDRAGQMLNKNGDNNRIESIKQNLKMLHNENDLSPSIDKTDLLDDVLQNLDELENMLQEISGADSK